jgi:hypothetical protein
MAIGTLCQPVRAVALAGADAARFLERGEEGVAEEGIARPGAAVPIRRVERGHAAPEPGQYLAH